MPTANGLFEEWKKAGGVWGGHHGTEDDPSGWFAIPDNSQKFHGMRAASVGGHCYILLLLSISRMKAESWAEMSGIAQKLKDKSKRDPVGKEMMIDFMDVLSTWLLTRRYDVGEPTNEKKEEVSRELLEHLMESKVRYEVSDSGILHLALDRTDGCSCKEPVCEHGWSTRAVVVLLGSSDKKVGAAGISGVDFSAIGLGSTVADEFETVLEYPRLSTQPKVEVNCFNSPPPPPSPGWDQPMAQQQHFREPTRPAQVLSPRPLDFPQRVSAPLQHWESMGSLGKVREQPNLNDFRERAKEALRNVTAMSEELTKIARAEKIATDQMKIIGELVPGDSSSQFGTREKNVGRYMNPGTVFSNHQEFLSVLEEDLSDEPNLTIGNVVSGFKKTQSMVYLERKAFDEITSINGLPQPFRNDRLNLLMHLDTSFPGVSLDSSDVGLLTRSLVKFQTSSPSTTSEELLQAVFRSLLDMKNMRIKSNLFSLPYVEVGMSITEDTLVKMFDMIKNEYIVLWFDELKSLKIPSFHDQYSRLAQAAYRPKPQESPAQHQPSSHRGQRKRRSSSILGF